MAGHGRVRLGAIRLRRVGFAGDWWCGQAQDAGEQVNPCAAVRVENGRLDACRIVARRVTLCQYISMS